MGIVCGTSKNKKQKELKNTKDKPFCEKIEKEALVNEIQRNKTLIKEKGLEKFIFFTNINEQEEFFIISNFENLKCASLIKRYYVKWEEILLFTRPQRKKSYRNLNKNSDFSIFPKEKNSKTDLKDLKREDSKESNLEEKLFGNENMVFKYVGETEEISNLVEKFEIAFSFNKYRYIKYLSKGPPNNLRWTIWISLALCQSKNDFITREEYAELVNKIDVNFIRYEEEQIKKDLNRSNPYSNFLQKEKNLDSLYNILKAIAIKDPELGYCQGMNILAANFLLISDGNEYETFNLLNFLFKHLELREFFLNGFPKLIMYIFILNQFIKDNMPKLFEKIIELDIPEETWIFKWLQTLYNLTLPLSITIRLLDCIICFGVEFLLNFSLAFIKFFEKKLLECKDINDFLKIFDIYDIINPDVLLPSEKNELTERNKILYTNNNNISENIEEFQKSNNSLNNKTYLINKKDDLILFREKLIKNAKKIDLKDSIKKLIENYNKENIEIKNKFKENESSTGDGLQEEKDILEDQQNEIVKNDNSFPINYQNRENEIDLNKIDLKSIREKYSKHNNSVKFEEIDDNNSIRNSVRIEKNLTNENPNDFFNLQKYSKNSKKFGEWKLKENEIISFKRKSFDPIEGKGINLLQSVKEFYDNEKEDFTEEKDYENSNGNADYISKKDELSIQIKQIENNIEKNESKIFPNTPNKEEGNYEPLTRLKNKNDLRLFYLNSIETPTNKKHGVFTCKNKSNSPEVDSLIFNNKINTNKHMSKMSFFNNNFINFFSSKNFELKKSHNSNQLNESKNYSRINDTINKIKNKLEMIKDINEYEKEENEDFEENLEEFEKRSIIDRSIGEYGLRKFSFLTSVKAEKKNKNELELDKTNPEMDSIYADNSYFENEIRNITDNSPTIHKKTINKNSKISPIDDNNKINNKEEKNTKKENKRNNFFSKSFIQKKKVNFELPSQPVKKNINDYFKDKDITTKEKEEENIFNQSHMDFDFKNSEILKDSGIIKVKTSNNLIKIQLNNIVVSHDNKKDVFVEKFKIKK